MSHRLMKIDTSSMNTSNRSLGSLTYIEKKTEKAIVEQNIRIIVFILCNFIYNNYAAANVNKNNDLRITSFYFC